LNENIIKFCNVLHLKSKKTLFTLVGMWEEGTVKS